MAEDNGKCAGELGDDIAALSRIIGEAERLVVLTGAGISTESGIPDFRSPGGIWMRMKPITYGEFVASEAARLEDWRRRFVMNASFAAASPNAGHYGLAKLAENGRLRALVTQNIDGLHQRAGLPPERMIEIHGNATHGRCLDCSAPMSLTAVRQMIDRTGASPRCACGGPVKAAIISFGERMPADDLGRACKLASEADLFLVIGSSLRVQPANALPSIARRSGADLVIINRDPTPLDNDAALLVRQPIGAVFEGLFPQLVNSE
jgi:NAD-dependent deacetylase